MVSKKFKVIGGTKNFWTWSKDGGFDLTHPLKPTSPPVYPRIPLATRKGPITIDPHKTALVIVDMQNYFLSPLLGRPFNSVGLKAVDELLKHAIPACRKAEIPIVWLGWGLTEKDIDEMPPSIARGYQFGLDTNFEDGIARDLGALGEDMGQLKLDDGTVIEAGRVMMCDQWNTAFYPPLVEVSQPQDIWISKNRLSGFWGGTGIEEVLVSRGIRTLLFAGENTDQCVAGSMQDAYTKGWDCLMLSDGCATTSPEFATKCIELNCENGWGFVLTCKQVADGVDNIQKAA
ncbi:Isochorismatase-like protein [Xylogone sp. PMI_703]|nr:Isochorismatase-like protein [Xylogone sp. PMI_703]